MTCQTLCLMVQLCMRVESYKHLGFVVHATKAMTFGTSFLSAAVRKAMFAMRRRCVLLGIRDPAMQCKLFDTLVLPILSYACEVWSVNPNVGEAAEVLHGSFLKHLLGVRTCTANETVLAEFGRFPLQPVTGSLLAADFALPSQSSSIRQISPCQACNG